MIDGLVSIVMPLYNGSTTVMDSIQSVRQQTYKDWELLVVDDGSTDNGPKLVSELAEEDGRIRLLHMQQNGGAAAARNYGITQVQGQYLAFLDSDDLWLPEKLEMQLRLMKEAHTSFGYGACHVIEADGRDTGKVRQVPKQLDFRHAVYGNPIPCLSVLLDLSAIQRQYPKLKMEFPNIGHEDYALWLTILQAGVVAYGIQEPIGSYRKNANSLSGNKCKAAGWTYRIYREYLHFGRLRSIVCFVGYAFAAIRKRI